MFIDVRGPVMANTAYVNNQLVAHDVAFALPEITPMTADVQAMGSMSLPIWGLFEDMESTITKIGVDLGLAKLITPQPMTIEYRWVQSVTSADGSTREEGCKAFLRQTPKKIPGIGGEVGSSLEGEVTGAVTRYQLFVGGQELFLLDRTASIFRVNGVDYYSKIASLL